MITISISILVPESTELAHGVLGAQPILSLFAVTVISAVLGPILSWWCNDHGDDDDGGNVFFIECQFAVDDLSCR